MARKKMTIRSILNSEAFNLGFRDVRNGRSFRYEYDWPSQTYELLYTRGRQFAVVFPKPIKENRDVSTLAMYAFQQAWADQTII
jgi:hypothetical protein